MTASLLANKGVKWVTMGWLGFIGENLIMSHNREYLIQHFGDQNYHLTYNALSTVACSSIAYGYFKYGKLGGATLKRRSPLLQFLGFGVQAIGLIGLSQLAPALQIPVAFGEQPPPSSAPKAQQQKSAPKEHANSSTDFLGATTDQAPQTPTEAQAQAGAKKFYVRCPIDFRPKRSSGDGSGDDSDAIYGVERVTRHPALWFMGLTALGSAITTVYPTHVAMFVFPIVFAWIGGAHQDYRFRRGNGGQLSPEMDKVTSNVPFVALVNGKQRWSALRDETKWTNAALATILALSFALKRMR